MELILSAFEKSIENGPAILQDALAKMILSIEDRSIIDKVLKVLQTETNDYWLELSENERKNIQLGIQQLENGDDIELKDFINRAPN